MEFKSRLILQQVLYMYFHQIEGVESFKLFFSTLYMEYRYSTWKSESRCFVIARFSDTKTVERADKAKRTTVYELTICKSEIAPFIEWCV